MNILFAILLGLATALALYVAFHWTQAKAELPPDAPRELRIRELCKRLGSTQRST